MPDHPSWPAELVEKAADVIMEFVELRYDETVDCTVVARTLASALSGDLVPREEHERALARLRAVEETLNTVGAPTHDNGPTLNANGRLVDWLAGRRSEGWRGKDPVSEARSQADALAEALQQVIRHGNNDDGCGGECTLFQPAITEARSALASYRKTTSGASGETEGEG